LVDVFGWQVRWAVGNHRAQLAIGDSAAIAVVQGEISAGSAIDHVMVRVADVTTRRRRVLAKGVAVGEIAEFPYGERQYIVSDFAGRP
jgi:hypothetical protein